MSELHASDTVTQQPDDEISLLDLLATLTDNLRLLVLGPIVVGLLALGITFLVTPTYESRSVLKLEGDNTALLASDDVLSPLLSVATWLPASHSRTVQLTNLREHIRPSFNKKDETHVITVTAPSAEQAQTLHIALIDQLRKQLQPKGKALADIRQRQTTAQATLDELNTVIPAMSKDIARPGAKNDAGLRAYSLLLEQRLNTQKILQEANNELNPFGDEAFAQAPSLADRPVKPKKALIALLTGLASGFLLLIFVFIRQAIRNAASNPQDAARLVTIRRNLSRSVGLSRKR